MDPVFQTLRDRFLEGTLSPDGNRLHAIVTPPNPEDLKQLPDEGTDAWRLLESIGRQELDEGRVGLVILAGGMATRFSWDQPKALFPIHEGISFLGWKLIWAHDQMGDGAPVYIMTSFHTHDAIARHLEENAWFGLEADRIHLFRQGRLPRMNLDGTPFAGLPGHDAEAAPGHGDFGPMFRSSGLLGEFLAEGGRTLLFSNVDNLGATPDPLLIGHHLQSGKPMTAEVAAKAPGDKGGAPALVAGRLQLVEGFALPEAFDQETLTHFNTATYMFDATALDRDLDLPWYVVEKNLDGQRILQFERLAGDLSTVLDLGVAVVDRSLRFIPVKSQDELASAREDIRRKASALQTLPLR
ncbi:MAG: UTP--glucose-1-phosphate uridylyltransferase [Candidatus Sericytochromatia bacterium]|nr:UTP--glucose-1-phosphate uridylyltransferase [Candidatus Sericytochromatia bacterium]